MEGGGSCSTRTDALIYSAAGDGGRTSTSPPSRLEPSFRLRPPPGPGHLFWVGPDWGSPEQQRPASFTAAVTFGARRRDLHRHLLVFRVGEAQNVLCGTARRSGGWVEVSWGHLGGGGGAGGSTMLAMLSLC